MYNVARLQRSSMSTGLERQFPSAPLDLPIICVFRTHHFTRQAALPRVLRKTRYLLLGCACLVNNTILHITFFCAILDILTHLQQ